MKNVLLNQILDLMYLNFPPYRKALRSAEKLYYATFAKFFVKKSISVITDSRHAKSEIINTWKIDPKKIVVIPLGLANRYKPIKDVDDLKVVQKKFNLPRKFILYLGNFKPHKNVKSLVKAFKKKADTF